MKSMPWRLWRRKKTERILIAEIRGEVLTTFERLADDMNADEATVFDCALILLEWLVQHAKEGGELIGQNSTEEFGLGLTYKNKQGQLITIPPKDKYDATDSSKPHKTLRLSKNDKNFFRDIGIEPD